MLLGSVANRHVLLRGITIVCGACASAKEPASTIKRQIRPPIPILNRFVYVGSFVIRIRGPAIKARSL